MAGWVTPTVDRKHGRAGTGLTRCLVCPASSGTQATSSCPYPKMELKPSGEGTQGCNLRSRVKSQGSQVPGYPAVDAVMEGKHLFPLPAGSPCTATTTGSHYPQVHFNVHSGSSIPFPNFISLAHKPSAPYRVRPARFLPSCPWPVLM